MNPAATSPEPTDSGVARPVVPDYSGPNVRGIIPGLLAPGGTSGQRLPDWFPEAARSAERTVLLVLDGLGWHQLQDHLEHMPTLADFQGRSIHTVAPTTTATALSSIATGLTPAEHGLVGYRIALRGQVMNVLRWTVEGTSVRRSNVPSEIQPYPPFLGEQVPVVSPAELQNSAFTEAHLRGSRPVGWRATSSIAVEAAQQLAAGERFVYCYYGGIDKIAHERGFGPYYDAELRYADALVADLLETLPAGTALLVTADHGQVEVGGNIIHPSAEMLRGVVLQSGEGRFRWLHTAAGAVADVAAAADAEVGASAWVVTLEQMLDERWFGSGVTPEVRARFGDVALVAREPVSFYEAADSGPFELVCRHGSLTPDEVDVPFVGALAS